MREARKESARLWNQCKDLGVEARRNGAEWPNEKYLRNITKVAGYQLHSQTVQEIVKTYLANIDTTTELRKQGKLDWKYPWRDKYFYTPTWPGQAMNIQQKQVSLPMGRGRKPLVLKLKLPSNATGCKLVYKDGLELHVSVPAIKQPKLKAGRNACIDLGEVHHAAVVVDNGTALLISGRGIRSIKREQNMILGQIASKRSKCAKGSRRYRKLCASRAKHSARFTRRTRDLRHKATRQAINFCKQEGVTSLFVGDPEGTRYRKNVGRHHAQRMSQWEFGVDRRYPEYKSGLEGIAYTSGPERGTSSECPACHDHCKKSGRNWNCKKCGFKGHRDFVGGTNMHPIGFGIAIEYPTRKITYLRPGPIRGSSRSLDTGQCCLEGQAG